MSVLTVQCYFSDKYVVTYQKMFKGLAIFWNSPAIFFFSVMDTVLYDLVAADRVICTIYIWCILEQPLRFFRAKEQQTIDWTLGENVTYVIPNNFCKGGFSYSFGGNLHFFESKRNNYAMNSSGFNFGCYGAASSFLFISPAVSC